jgi:hypothetical protein
MDQIQHLIIQQGGESIPARPGTQPQERSDPAVERGAPATGALLAEHDLSGRAGQERLAVRGDPAPAPIQHLHSLTATFPREIHTLSA